MVFNKIIAMACSFLFNHSFESYGIFAKTRAVFSSVKWAYERKVQTSSIR